MRLLPSEQGEAIEAALLEFAELGYLEISEPCNCGSQVRHNNGGNYHQIITLREDRGETYVKYDSTCELAPAAEWEPCEDAEGTIRQYSDWLPRPLQDPIAKTE